MSYINDIKYDDVTRRFMNNIMKYVSDSIIESNQPNVNTPVVNTGLKSQCNITGASNTSNTNIASAQNPIHGILNAAFNFNSSPDVANSLGPVADIIMETINMLSPQTSTPSKKDSYVKKPEQPNSTTQTSNCSVNPMQNTTAPGSKCPYAACSKLYELSNKIRVLRNQINELPGGIKYLEKIDKDHDAVIYQLMMQNYEKLLVFREDQNISVSIASIVQKQQPKAILPDNAKKELVAYVNAADITNAVINIYDIVSLTKQEYAKLETLVTTWLSENSEMYVVV